MAILPWLKRDSRWRIVPLAASLALTVRYLVWRLLVTIPSADQTTDFVAGCLFFAIEFAAVFGSILSLVTLMRTKSRSAEVESNTDWLLERPELPKVDVFICTYNEEAEILERTIVGAMAMDYTNYRVWVLDDGRRAWLRDLARDHGCEYLTRPDNAHAKAGNINHALSHVAGLPERPDFVAILDADFVPSKAFLWRAMTLFKEEDVGVVQTPQHFYNPDPIQANLLAADTWPDEQRYFFDIVMPAKDAWGTAFCCGTSSVIRMAALDKCGGIPTDSVTEDYLLTLRLLQVGYRTVYLNERLSLGLAPEGLKEYVTQRSRWCLGFMQIFRSKDGPLAPGNGLRIVDRIGLFESFLFWSATYLFRVTAFIVPVIYLLLDIHALDVDLVDGISHFLPYYFVHIGTIVWLSERRILPVMTDLSQLLGAREILRAIAIGLLKPYGHKFKVTAKGGDRNKLIVQWRMMVPFIVLLVLTILGVITAFSLDTDRALQDSSVIALYWSWYNIMILLLAIAVCVERPRVRKDERLKTEETVALHLNGEVKTYTMVDISVSGGRLLGEAPGPPGTRVSILLGSQVLDGKIARKLDDGFAIEIEQTIASRAAMIRHVYSGSHRSGVDHIRAISVAKRVFARLSR
ncbi:MAG: glycosyltransferase [Hyphomicrobiales bacterium]|nr:glycosyltransferase [Hyphomicrobiales bacterium]